MLYYKYRELKVTFRGESEFGWFRVLFLDTFE